MVLEIIPPLKVLILQANTTFKSTTTEQNIKSPLLECCALAHYQPTQHIFKIICTLKVDHA